MKTIPEQQKKPLVHIWRTHGATEGYKLYCGAPVDYDKTLITNRAEKTTCAECLRWRKIEMSKPDFGKPLPGDYYV